MKCKKLLVISALVISSLIIITSCGVDEQTTPVYTPIADPPIEVTIEQLLAGYLDNDLAQYEDKKLLFSGVVVEGINTVSIDSANASTIYPVNNIIEFRPRYRTDTRLVREGYVIDIVGVFRGVFGMTNPYIVVDDCWIKIIEGDLGVGDYEDPDY